MAKATNYEEMSIEELDQLIIDLSNERAALREKQLDVVAVYDRKVNAAKAAQLTATMTDPEKRALLQHLAIDGIDESGAVGDPTANEGN